MENGKGKADYYTPAPQLPSDLTHLRANYLAELEVPYIPNNGQSPPSEHRVIPTTPASGTKQLERSLSQPATTNQLPHRSLIEKIINKFTGKAA